MGDQVGAYEPQVKHIKGLIRKYLDKDGVDPDTIDPRSVQQFAVGIATQFHRQMEEKDFQALIRDDPNGIIAWKQLSER